MRTAALQLLATQQLATSNPALVLKRHTQPGCLTVTSNSSPQRLIMRAVKFTSWNDGEFYIGFLNDYPDYMTQGLSKEDLKDNLRSLLDDLESREIPYTKKLKNCWLPK
jgi:predicted RNase H-like HicB family nuclease